MTDSSLSLGSPRFSDASLAGLASAEGVLVAWHEAVTKDARQAAAGVTGDFAVGLHLPDGRAFLAVDRFAICTLCYRVDNGQLRFAARADDLADTSTEIDPQAIFDYLFCLGNLFFFFPSFTILCIAESIIIALK